MSETNATISTRIKHAWNAFFNKDPTIIYPGPNGAYARPDRVRLSRGNERSIITSVYNRIAVDAAAINIMHVQLDDNGRYVRPVDSGLNNCLTLEANVDQTGRAFIQDVVMSMFDEGCVAIVPVDTSADPWDTTSFDILSLRTGKIVKWYPRMVTIEVYNDIVGKKQEITLPKEKVAIIENPFYSIMNEPNSTMQRLIRKLNLLDYIDEQNGSGKLDLIIQLPYVIKTEARRAQAEQRRKDIEDQLTSSNYGIAYTDGTEHITQLNRSVDNQLLNQVTELKNMLYSQLGITDEIMNGTANEQTMNGYYNRIIEPVLSSIVDGMKRTFLTKTARGRGQSICFFRDPFKLVPTSEIAEIADKFTRNEIMTSNEIRQIVGMKPSDDPEADQLRNKNLSQSKEELQAQPTDEEQQLNSEEKGESSKWEQ